MPFPKSPLRDPPGKGAGSGIWREGARRRRASSGFWGRGGRGWGNPRVRARRRAGEGEGGGRERERGGEERETIAKLFRFEMAREKVARGRGEVSPL